MAQDEIFNLDAVRAAHVAEKGEIERRPFVLYSKTWEANPEPNVVAGLLMLDKAAEAEGAGQFAFMMSYVRGDQREELIALMLQDDYMDIEMITKLANFLAGETTGVPTQPSSSSEDGSETTGEASKEDSSTEEVLAASST